MLRTSEASACQYLLEFIRFETRSDIKISLGCEQADSAERCAASAAVTAEPLAPSCQEVRMQRKNFLGLAALLAAYVFGATPLAAQEPISFTKEVKPILDAKCVSCHACYEFPAQLDLRNAKGIQRGAMKIEGYLARLKEVPPTRIWDSPNTIEDWRKRGFFSVTEGGKDSIMARMLATRPQESRAAKRTISRRHPNRFPHAQTCHAHLVGNG